MQNYFKKESPEALVFQSKIENIPGGITVAVKDLTQTRIKAGTPVGMDANGLYHVVKTARIQTKAESAETGYKVEKGHNFKAGDILALGAKGYAITGIDTSNANFDILTVGTTLGVAEVGAVLFEGNKSAASAVTFKYSPIALVGTTFDVLPGNNHLTDGVVRGSVKEKNIGAPISDAIKAALPLIRFV